jgi:prepilin-type N-terminal cleavage/methylation domain-containing protein
MKRQRASRTPNESGVTIIELVIAMAVLSVGLCGLAQLFVVSTMNNAYAVTTSGGINDAQRLIEAWKAEAWLNGIGSSAITSAAWDSSSGSNPAFAALSGYDSGKSQYREYVWVFNRAGSVVGTISPSTPPDLPSGTTLQAVSTNSRLVYIRLEPKNPDPRYNQVITLSAIIYSTN